MPTTNRQSRHIRRSRISVTKKSIKQPTVRKSIKRHNIHRLKNKIPIFRNVPTSRYTGSFDTTTLNLAPKLGYDILNKVYKIRTDFSVQQKKEALMLHRCLRHMEGYQDKMFTDVNDAVSHVFKEASRLITTSWMFTTSDDYDEFADNVKIPQQFELNIIHETFEPDGVGRWQSYCDIFKHAKGDKTLKDTLCMCMQIILGKFGFSCFDYEGTSNVMSMEDWYEWEIENAIGELQHYVGQKKSSAQDIKDAEERVQQIKKVKYDYYKYAVPIQKAIYKVTISETKLEAAADKYGGDFADWIRHILFLYKRNFNIGYYYVDGSPIYADINDDDCYAPHSAFGYVFNGDNIYAQAVNSNFNEVMNNYGCIPFMNFETIDSEEGYTRQLSDDPVLEWMRKIFKFNFSTFKYESDRSSPTLHSANNV